MRTGRNNTWKLIITSLSRMGVDFETWLFAHENDANGHGLGDIEIAASKTLLRQRGWLPDLVARAYWKVC